MKEPKKLQVTNLFRNRRKVMQTIVQNDIGDVITRCKNNEKVPVDPDTTFVVNYDIGDPNDADCHMRIFICGFTK